MTRSSRCPGAPNHEAGHRPRWARRPSRVHARRSDRQVTPEPSPRRVWVDDVRTNHQGSSQYSKHYMSEVPPMFTLTGFQDVF
jgi:hypothetical protein